MLQSSMTAKGQVTIPLPLRRELGLQPGDRVAFSSAAGKVFLTRQAAAIESTFGLVKAKKSATLQDMENAIAKELARRARR